MSVPFSYIIVELIFYISEVRVVEVGFYENRENYYNILTREGDVILIDLMNHLHRFLWVHKDLSVIVDGEEVRTGHIYGFLQFLTVLRDRFPKGHFVIVLDGNDKTRRELNPDYKSGRDRSFDMYKDVWDIVRFSSLLDGVYFSYHEDYEADDTICSLCESMTNLCRSNHLKKDIYILSNDKDMYQLVREGGDVNVRIIRKFGQGRKWMEEADLVDTSKVRETFNGVYPENLVKFRAISGDSSDRLKGYYRFRKSNAATIAENFDYSVEKKGFVLKEGVSFDSKWDSMMAPVLRDINLFDTNYRIMKMKVYPATIGRFDCKDSIESICKKLDVLKMRKFIQKILTKGYSPYRQRLYKYLTV